MREHGCHAGQRSRLAQRKPKTPKITGLGVLKCATSAGPNRPCIPAESRAISGSASDRRPFIADLLRPTGLARVWIWVDASARRQMKALILDRQRCQRLEGWLRLRGIAANRRVVKDEFADVERAQKRTRQRRDPEGTPPRTTRSAGGDALAQSCRRAAFRCARISAFVYCGNIAANSSQGALRST